MPAVKSWMYIHCHPLARTAASGLSVRGCNQCSIKATRTLSYHHWHSLQQEKHPFSPLQTQEISLVLLKDLLRRNWVIKETCSGSEEVLTIQGACWVFLQLEIWQSQVLFFYGLGEYKQRKEDFNNNSWFFSSSPILKRLINPIPPNMLHPSRAYTHEPQRNSYLGLIFASSIIFLKSSLACIILFFFSLRSSSARVFTYWSNTYRNTSHPQQTHKWHTEARGIREKKSHFFPLLWFPLLSPQNQHRGGRNLRDTLHFNMELIQAAAHAGCCT